MVMGAKDEGDAEEEQQEGDQEDQGELLLQVGQPGRSFINCIQKSVGMHVMVFCLPGDDGERKAAHDDPLAIEHLQERLDEEEEDGG